MITSPYKIHLDELIEKGFTKISLSSDPVINQLLSDLKNLVFEQTKNKISSLDEVHLAVTKDKINEFRLSAIKLINNAEFKSAFIKKISPFFSFALGEDLACQKNLNLVLVPPQDKTSILPLHADTWTGHSKFELALLFPLTNILPEQNMFILPLSAWKKHHSLIQKAPNLQHLTDNLAGSLEYLNLKAGEAMIFWHSLPHGNKINESDLSHWSINFRFKNIFTPYEEKGLGDYFVPYKMSRFNEFVFKETTREPEWS